MDGKVTKLLKLAHKFNSFYIHGELSVAVAVVVSGALLRPM